MRSFVTQIILVVCMIIAGVLAIRLWNTEFPKIDISLELPANIATPQQADNQKMIRVVCPEVPMEDPDAEPQWTVAPRPTDTDYPGQALRLGISGVVRVACLANPDGMVSDCTVVEEQPADYGFGESALKVIRRGCMTTFPSELEPKVFSVNVPFSLDPSIER